MKRTWKQRIALILVCVGIWSCVADNAANLFNNNYIVGYIVAVLSTVGFVEALRYADKGIK